MTQVAIVVPKNKSGGKAEDTRVAIDIGIINAEIARIVASQTKLRAAIDAIVADLGAAGSNATI